jgi:imidazolonepropionase-like amidohydrolase
MRFKPILAVAVVVCLGACTTTNGDPGAEGAREAFGSTYQPGPSMPTLIRGGTVLDGNGGELENTDVLMRDGRIASVGANLAAPAGVTVIEASGRFVTPGIIDAHSHLGVYPSPSINATSDGNEATQPNTAEVWAEHSIWPQDPGFERAVAGGATALHILPGSANLFGGRGVTVRPVLGARTVQEMKFPGAPQSLKMACGENPARVYGGRNSSPSTGMGVIAGYRQAFANAQRYARRAEAAESGDGEPPDRDLEMETLAGVLTGEIILQWHCYRADEMANAIEVAREFDFEIAAFHHAVEAYKIADLLAEEEICAAMWADWWGFKIEAYDGIRENISFVHASGGCAIVHSDSEVGVQRLNQEAAKALSDGRRAGLEISRGEAWTWLSRNPARALHIDDETGTIEPGRRADIVIWSADPLSSYALADHVFIDGSLVYERSAPREPASDFEVGQTHREGAQ